MRTNPPLLSLIAAQTRLGRRSFGPFHLDIEAGERVAILGPSGAGKSTLLRLMAGELPCSAGSAALEGTLLARSSLIELSRRRAVLPQSTEVAFGLDCDLVIALGRVARHHDPDLAHIVREAAMQAHAGHLLGRRCDTLSGGEKARVQLARIFAQMWDREAGLILVDEPLSALDPGLQIDLLDKLDAFARQRGHAVVAVLHDINQALQAFSRLLLVLEGALMNDLPSHADAVPQLEALYGIQLQCFDDGQGSTLVLPWRAASAVTTS
ncbi:ABC transporter ATP-binding protein [Viridibacterium curvum]|uniref:Heme ABC transporter ATP-binding protein n=1 Tax=Viridibacterium curvum TaxID=1101404 RepID=A0ABP9QME8_9RHOO